MMSINLVLAGMMLICLHGDEDCPIDKRADKKPTNMNTAWVVTTEPKADLPCGHDDDTKTTLKVRFCKGDFQVSRELHCDELEDLMTCTLPPPWYLPDNAGNPVKICIWTSNPTPKQVVDTKSLERLLGIDELDRRFQSVGDPLRSPSFPLNFPPGKISAKEEWGRPIDSSERCKYPARKAKTETPTIWHRWDDHFQSGDVLGKLSDRMQVEYPGAKTLMIGRCDYWPQHLEFKVNPNLGQAVAEIEILNQANRLKVLPRAESHADKDTYAYMPYLFWYYQLGSWGPYRECPFEESLIGCRGRDLKCAVGISKQDSTFWPVLRGPRTAASNRKRRGSNECFADSTRGCNRVRRERRGGKPLLVPPNRYLE